MELRVVVTGQGIRFMNLLSEIKQGDNIRLISTHRLRYVSRLRDRL
jgi:hypothetical protein